MSRIPSRLARIAAAGATVAAVTLMGASAASAHVSPVEGEVPAGSYTAVQLRVPHGCDGESTEKVDVQIPESITSASPFWVSGWTAATEEAPLDPPVDDGEGGEITERTATVSWTAAEGNALPDHQVLDFGISFKAPDEVGEVLYFKTIQTCGDATAEWITEWDGTGEEPEKPAPSVTVVEGSGDGHGAEDAEDAEDETTETTAAASGTDGNSSDDDSSDSSQGVAIAGLVAGLAGLGLGGAAFAKTRKG